MPAPKWLIIAKNEYRLRTSRIKRLRPFFPFLIIGLLAAFLLLLMPAIINLLVDEIEAFFLSQVALAAVEIMLFMIFIFFLMFPITYTLQQAETGQFEILLAAPLRPKDLLLGKFMGEMPLYAIGVAVVAGIFTAILSPLGLDMIQMTIVILIFILIFFSALWIGTVIAAILRTRLGKTARGRDIGKALAMIIALPMIALMYAIIGGGLFESLAEPETSGTVKTLLGLFPSSWGAEIIVDFASNPGNIIATWFETLIRFGGLIVFFVTVLWLGAKIANRAYSLEPTTFTAAKAKPDGTFYKTVKYIGGGGSFGALLVSIFKDYGRRFENISKIAYLVGLLILINIFFIGSDYGSDENGENPVTELVFASIMLAAVFPLLAAFVVGEVTIRGKENLFIYRKAPSGEGRLIKARLLQSWIVVLPVVAAISAYTAITIPHTTYFLMLIYTGYMIILISANVAFALGLFLMMPVFSEKPGELMGNAMVIMMVSMGVFIISIEIFGGIFGLLMVIAINWIIGIVFLSLGKRKLSSIE